MTFVKVRRNLNRLKQELPNWIPSFKGYMRIILKVKLATSAL